MAKESLKSHPSRLRNGDYEKYLHGDILDVGCGDDLLTVPNGAVKGWDLEDGDAQYLKSVPDKSFDAVHASHCLEHMADVPTALHHWARVVKFGGSVHVTVPDWTLYEHQIWPSMHNPDHKASFSLIDIPSLPSHPFYGLRQMKQVGLQCGLTLVDARMVCDGYDFSRINDPHFDQTQHGVLAQIVFIFQKL